MQFAKRNEKLMVVGIRNGKRSRGTGGGIWLLITLMLTLLALLQQMQPCECRYLPTRSHGDDLDKLRELMLQILETSNEDDLKPQQQPQQQQLLLNSDLNGGNSVAQRANWINKLDGPYDGMDVLPRKYRRRSMYENDRFY